MVDKTTYLRAFNTHLFEFIDDIIRIFPDNMNIATTKTTFEMTKKANPTLLIKVWYKFVYSPYSEIIDAGDLDFFINIFLIVTRFNHNFVKSPKAWIVNFLEKFCEEFSLVE